MKIIIFYLIILFSLNAEDKKDETSEHLTAGLLKIVELSVSSSFGNRTGAETMGSIVSGVRQANSILSNENELFKVNQSNAERNISNKFTYSQKISELFYFGIRLNSQLNYQYDRTTIGNKGSYLVDSTNTKENMFGVRFGLGPLDYLDSFSYELSLGYEEQIQKGPYSMYGIKRPFVENGKFTDLNLFLGNGFVSFDTKIYSILTGISFTGDIFGMYGLFDFQFASGNFVINSVGLNSTIKIDENIPPSNSIQAASLYINDFFGFLYHNELGGIIKFNEYVGIKTGFFFQIPFVMVDKPKGYYYENNTWNEASIANKFTNVATKEIFNLGINFSLVTRFY